MAEGTNSAHTLVLGGARSGKSDQALELAMKCPAPWVFIATAQALDEEMQERIRKHRLRRGEGWITIEAPIDLANAIDGAPTDSAIVVDCLTLWLSNLMLAGCDLNHEIARLDAALDVRKTCTVLVSNEVGLGIIPETPLGRDFRDQQGALNKHFAERAGEVVFMVAGLPMRLKP
jgi:adenosylcobinamide kinase/adenosylcobinamide-phosphate guanylyltransferase